MGDLRHWFGRAQKKAEDQIMHTIAFGGAAVRAVRPFDWLAFLRGWGLEFTEVREPGDVYQKITGPLKPMIGPNPCVYVPDDRTIVLDEEGPIRRLIRREQPGFRPTFQPGVGAGQSRPPGRRLQQPRWRVREGIRHRSLGPG